MTSRAISVTNTILSLGLNRLIGKLRVDPRWRWALWTAILANELRGATFVYEALRHLAPW